jgi:addiction module RelE/StbE family toxin
MKLVFSPDAKKDLAAIKKTNAKLAKKIVKQLEIFIKDPKHPSLRTPKLKGKMGTYWSISVGMSYRIVYLTEGEKILIVGIGTHDEVYFEEISD